MNINAQYWVDTLRWGDWPKEGTSAGALHIISPENFGWNIFGVAIELYCFKTAYHNIDRELSDKRGCELFNGSPSVPPPEVIEWLGLSDFLGSFWVPGRGVKMSLRQYNDGGWCDFDDPDEDRPKSFEELADVIESEPDGLFKHVDKEVRCKAYYGNGNSLTFGPIFKLEMEKNK